MSLTESSTKFPMVETQPEPLRTDRLFRSLIESEEIGRQAMERFLARSEQIADQYYIVDDKQDDIADHRNQKNSLTDIDKEQLDNDLLQ